jgi:hypothetical protein
MSIRSTARRLLALSAALTLGACSAERLTAPTRISAPSAAAHDDIDPVTCRSGYSVPDGRTC